MKLKKLTPFLLTLFVTTLVQAQDIAAPDANATRTGGTDCSSGDTNDAEYFQYMSTTPHANTDYVVNASVVIKTSNGLVPLYAKELTTADIQRGYQETLASEIQAQANFKETLFAPSSGNTRMTRSVVSMIQVPADADFDGTIEPGETVDHNVLSITFDVDTGKGTAMVTTPAGYTKVYSVDCFIE